MNEVFLTYCSPRSAENGGPVVVDCVLKVGFQLDGGEFRAVVTPITETTLDNGILLDALIEALRKHAGDELIALSQTARRLVVELAEGT